VLTLMALAAVADVVTMLVLPTGGELNPLAAFLIAVSPLAAIAAKLGLTLALIHAKHRLADYADGVYGFAAAAWSFGAITNLATVWR
jgi:hypothetical protein